jgi:hypothetical protein
MTSNGITEEKRTTVSFSGHETFVFRHGWLKKAVDAVGRNATAFGSDDALVELGVGKNMVRSIRFWGLATSVLEEVPKTRGTRLRPSTFGEFLLGKDGRDPYLEDPNSLWLLHWHLVTNEARSTTWCWAFNLLHSNEFTRESIADVMSHELLRRGIKGPSGHSMRRDIDCFVRTYAAPMVTRGAVLEDSLDCPLIELGLLLEDAASGTLQFRRGFQRSLAPEVFVYALLDFWEKVARDRESLAFPEIAYAFGSPGAAFKLDESSLAERLERLEDATDGVLAYVETAGLKQVYRRSAVSGMDMLGRYYEHSDPRFLIGA